MPATGPDLTRRALLAAFAAAPLGAADAGAEAWDVITAMASALGRGADREFLSLCDPALTGYDVLQANVQALAAAADVESGIDPVGNRGGDTARDVEVDWLLHIVERGALQRVTERRQVVKCRIEKRGRRWRVVAIEPVAFFAPPSAGADLAHQRVAGGVLR